MIQDGRDFRDQSLRDQADEEECTYIPGTEVPTHSWGIFWSELHRAFLLLALITTLLSEINWGGACERLFQVCIPMLSSTWGLAPLGMLQAFIAATVLSHYMYDFPLVVSWMLFVVGCINFLVGLLFRARLKSTRSIFAHRRRAAIDSAIHPKDKPYVSYSKIGKRKKNNDYGATSMALKALSSLKNIVFSTRDIASADGKASPAPAAAEKARQVSINATFPSIETPSHRHLLRQKAREANARMEQEQEKEFVVDMRPVSLTPSQEQSWHAQSQDVHERAAATMRHRKNAASLGGNSSVHSGQVKIGGYATARAASRAGSHTSSVSHTRSNLGAGRPMGKASANHTIRAMKRRSVAFARSARSRLSTGTAAALASRKRKGLQSSNAEVVESVISFESVAVPGRARAGLQPPVPALRSSTYSQASPSEKQQQQGLPVAFKYTKEWVDESNVSIGSLYR